MIRRGLVSCRPDAPEFSTFLDADLLNYAYRTAVHKPRAEVGNRRETKIKRPGRGATPRTTGIHPEFLRPWESATRENADPRCRSGISQACRRRGQPSRWLRRTGVLADQASRRSGRLTPMEQTLADLAMRDLSSIEQRTQSLRSSPQVSDRGSVGGPHLQRMAAPGPATHPPEPGRPHCPLSSARTTSRRSRRPVRDRDRQPGTSRDALEELELWRAGLSRT